MTAHSSLTNIEVEVRTNLDKFLHQDSFENNILHSNRPLLVPNSWSLQHLS